MRLFLLPLWIKILFLWFYGLTVSISFVLCLRHIGEQGLLVYGTGLSTNAYVWGIGWMSLIRGWHR